LGGNEENPVKLLPLTVFGHCYALGFVLISSWTQGNWLIGCVWYFAYFILAKTNVAEQWLTEIQV